MTELVESGILIIVTGKQKAVKIEGNSVMSPRALTAKEREKQKEQLLEVGKKLIIEQGIKKVSVDDITKACKVAKGTFYNYYDNKETMLLEIVWKIYSQVVDQAVEIFQKATPENIRALTEDFLKSILYNPQQVFLFSNHDELGYLLANTSGEQMDNFHRQEEKSFARLIKIAGCDIDRVKPAVVHNYIHAMYFATATHYIITDALPETLDIMVEGLLNYIFKEEDNT